jgi:hypothetical protein
MAHESGTRQQRFQHASDEANNPLLKAKRLQTATNPQRDGSGG